MAVEVLALDTPGFSDLSSLDGEVDEKMVTQYLQFTRQSGEKAQLRLAHVDLGSGTDCEQRMFDLRAERELRNTERAVHVGKKLSYSLRNLNPGSMVTNISLPG